MIETPEFTIVSPDEKYWIERKEASERMLKTLENDRDELPRNIEFHKAVIELCVKRIESMKEGALNSDISDSTTGKETARQENTPLN